MAELSLCDRAHKIFWSLKYSLSGLLQETFATPALDVPLQGSFSSPGGVTVFSTVHAVRWWADLLTVSAPGGGAPTGQCFFIQGPHLSQHRHKVGARLPMKWINDWLVGRLDEISILNCPLEIEFTFLGEPKLSFFACRDVASVSSWPRNLACSPSAPSSTLIVSRCHWSTLTGTQYGICCVPASCTKCFRDISQFQAQDDPQREVLLQLSRWGDQVLERRTGFSRGT